MKKSLKIFNRSICRIVPGIVITFSFAIMSFVANAQSTMTWTGVTSNNFFVDENWEPAGSPIDNDLIILMPDTTTATGDPNASPYVVEVTGSENISVHTLETSYASEDAYQSYVLINLDSDDVTFTVKTGNSSNCDYSYTGVKVQKGHYYFTRSNGPRLDNMNCWLRVEGGIAEFSNLLMGNSNTPSKGGKIYISGSGKVVLTDTFGRWYTGREDGQVEIIEEGVLEVNGNFVAPSENWINGGENYTIARSYNAITNKTIFTAKSSSYIGIENSDRQVLKTGEACTDTLKLLDTEAVISASSFQWRYRQKGETTFTNFSDSDKSNFAPVFNGSGTFLVSCLVDGVATENEVEFFVVSNAISFSPEEFSIQFVRIGEQGGEMTADFTSLPTSIEWKYSLNPGGPYVSFEPAATEASFKPVFDDSVANHYVVVEAEIEGNKHVSVELFYSVEAVSSKGKYITWTGLVSDDALNPHNWDPVSKISNNGFSLSELDTIDGVPPVYPIWHSEKNDTVYDVSVRYGTEAVWDFGNDSLNIRGSWQQIKDTLTLQSGYYYFTGYLRLDGAAGLLNVVGDSKVEVESLLMSDNKGSGGSINLNDNSILHCINVPGRFASDTLESVIYISDNSEIQFDGDQRSVVETYIDIYKIVCPDEGFAPNVLYDEINNMTYVRARNMNAFAIADDSRVYTTKGSAIENPITLTNVDGITGWEWKYAMSAFGPWESFDPAQNDVASFTPTFNAAGDYYIVAESSDGVITSNMKVVSVIELSISPAEFQRLDVEEEGETLNLSISLSDDLTLQTGEWIIYDELLGDQPTGIADTTYVPIFYFTGDYQVFYYAQVQDTKGVSYALLSNIVTFAVYPVSVQEVTDNSFELYPNPAKDAFYVNEVNKNYEVSVIDAQGKVVLSKVFNNVNGSQKINYNNSGIYLVKIQTNNIVKTKRIVIE